MMKKILFYISFIFLPIIIFAGSVSITDSVSTTVNDNTCFDKNFDIPIASAITNVIIEVNINHAWRADLNVSLTSPNGAVVNLTSGNGGSKNNLYTIFDDTAGQSIVTDNQNHNTIVTRIPEQLLSTFNGENTSGIWTLTICDTEVHTFWGFILNSSGTYNYATLTIYNADPTQPPLIDTIPNQAATLGNAFSFDTSVYVIETDGDPIISYRLDGTLPAGLSFDTATGIISGTPTTEEKQTLTLFATDADGESSGQSFLLGVYPPSPLVEYRMDECFWYNNSAIIGDVKDSSPFGSDATSSGTTTIVTNTFNPPICNYGTFGAVGDRLQMDNSVVLDNITTVVTVSAWLYPTSGTIVEWVAAIMKTSNESWDDGFGLANNASDNSLIKFFINGINNSVNATLDLNTWNHIVGVYNGTTLRIYKNGVEVGNAAYSNSITATPGSLFVGNDISDQFDDKWIGSIDEVQIWPVALTATEVQNLYTNQINGLNYDGTPRTCNTCSATVTAGVYELIGIPADLRGGTYTVADIIGDDIATPYGTDWRVYSRGYSDTNNSSWDNYLDLTSPLEFGQGYWLRSLADATWDANDIEAVNYDSTSPDCPTARCVELDIRSVILQDGVDDLLGTGRYRYNMTGAVGKKPINWADCRLLVDGVAYTPSAAETAGYMNKQIWQFNPASSNADLKGYTVCDDTTPGGCQLIPYKGFWIELQGPTKGKVLKLLVPEE